MILSFYKLGIFDISFFLREEDEMNNITAFAIFPFFLNTVDFLQTDLNFFQCRLKLIVNASFFFCIPLRLFSPMTFLLLKCFIQENHNMVQRQRKSKEQHRTFPQGGQGCATMEQAAGLQGWPPVPAAASLGDVFRQKRSAS